MTTKRNFWQTLSDQELFARRTDYEKKLAIARVVDGNNTVFATMYPDVAALVAGAIAAAKFDITKYASYLAKVQGELVRRGLV